MQKLIDEYARLREQIGILTAANNAQHEEIMRSHAELLELRKKYNDLQTAHAITTGLEGGENAGVDKLRARRQIASMIAKIDRVIYLLNSPDGTVTEV